MCVFILFLFLEKREFIAVCVGNVAGIFSSNAMTMLKDGVLDKQEKLCLSMCHNITFFCHVLGKSSRIIRCFIKFPAWFMLRLGRDPPG